MQNRTMFLAAAASAVVLAAAGTSFADSGGGADDTASPAPTATATPALDAQADGLRERRLVSAGSAGSVQYRFTDVLTIASVDPAPGWTAEIEQARGSEIEVGFTNGGRRIDVEVEIEDGAPRERVRERVDDDRSPDTEDGVRADDGIGHDVDDDHGGDRDRSDDDHDDRSGHRGGDDDRSGHRGGDDDDDRAGRDHSEDD